jgi:hypothetical protein
LDKILKCETIWIQHVDRIQRDFPNWIKRTVCMDKKPRTTFWRLGPERANKWPNSLTARWY